MGVYDGNSEYTERDAREHKAADMFAAEDAEFEYQLEEVYGDDIKEIVSALHEIEKKLFKKFPNKTGIMDKLLEAVRDGV